MNNAIASVKANEASWEDTMRKLRAISEQYSYLLE